MSQIHPRIINNIRDSADLFEICEREFGVEWKRQSGGWIPARCIFHEDTKPSFFYKPRTNRIYCFTAGCPLHEQHARGLDVFGLFMHHPSYRLSFPDAVRHVARLVGKADLVP